MKHAKNQFVAKDRESVGLQTLLICLLRALDPNYHCLHDMLHPTGLHGRI